MTEERKQEYISLMVANLPVLRAKQKLTQKDLADRIGVTNFSISGMEKGQRKMTWNTFISLLPVFLSNPDTADMMKLFGIYTQEIQTFLTFGDTRELTEDELNEVSAAGEMFYQTRKEK